MLKLMKGLFGSKKVITARPAARVGLDVNHNILLFVQEKSFRINNISSSGLGFIVEATHLFKIGQDIECEIEIFNIGQLKFNMKVVHVTQKLVGCQITDHIAEYAHLIDDYFESELSAKHLSTFSSDQLKNTVLGAPMLFTGKDCELYLIHQDKKLVAYKLTYKGNVVEQNKDGQILVSLMYGTSPVMAAEIPANLSEKCLRFVNSIDALSKELKTSISETIKKSSESTKAA